MCVQCLVDVVSIGLQVLHEGVWAAIVRAAGVLLV
jgi:hypothetical protein